MFGPIIHEFAGVLIGDDDHQSRVHHCSSYPRKYVNTSIVDVITYHLFNTPANSWIVGPNIAVQYSRPYFSCPNVKEKIAVWLHKTTQTVVDLWVLVTNQDIQPLIKLLQIASSDVHVWF